MARSFLSHIQVDNKAELVKRISKEYLRSTKHLLSFNGDIKWIRLPLNNVTIFREYWTDELIIAFGENNII